MFDLDYDPFTGKKKKSDAEKIRAALTPAMKEDIKRVVGYECEKCGRKGKLQIHHIKPVSKADGVDLNVDTNLIALCPNCHAEALTQAEMKRILAKRSKKVKQDITNIRILFKKYGKAHVGFNLSKSCVLTYFYSYFSSAIGLITLSSDF